MAGLPELELMAIIHHAKAQRVQIAPVLFPLRLCAFA
jgi:hypothetical protein